MLPIIFSALALSMYKNQTEIFAFGNTIFSVCKWYLHHNIYRQTCSKRCTRITDSQIRSKRCTRITDRRFMYLCRNYQNHRQTVPEHHTERQPPVYEYPHRIVDQPIRDAQLGWRLTPQK
jgi:hypothetical protein